MRNKLYILFFIFISMYCTAQTGNEVFGFLRFPTSTRANALGGHNISLVERDPSLIFHNPALLGGEMDGMINLNYMNYISDINVGSALFTKAHKERGAWGIGASFINYGTIREYLPENVPLGEFSPNDVSVQGFYSYDLTDRWRGGITMKFLYSSFSEYSSIGLGVDAGLSYYDEEKAFSFGFALKNMGAQIKAYNEERNSLPWDIQLGITKRMSHAPIRLSLTAMYLNRWKFDTIDDAVASGEEDSFFQTLAKHFVIGVDFVPSDNFWVGVGFNPKKNRDMKVQNGNKLGGFSAGAGVKISKFDVGVSVAKYHPSALALMISISTTLSDFRP